MSILLLLLLAGCAHDTLPAIRAGAEIAPHLISVAPLLDVPPALDVWEPSILYPAMQPQPSRDLAKSSVLADGPIRAAAWLWFRGYQSTISRVDGSTCRFRPTCSGFGIEAVTTHGILGLPMTFGRLHRSHADQQHYPMSNPPFLDDPLENYGFTLRRPRLDDFAAYDDPSHAWYQHVRATRRVR